MRPHAPRPGIQCACGSVLSAVNFECIRGDRCPAIPRWRVSGDGRHGPAVITFRARTYGDALARARTFPGRVHAIALDTTPEQDARDRARAIALFTAGLPSIRIEVARLPR